MRVALFCHSLISDWNHGNAHFLRGVVGELLRRRIDVRVYEPRDAWSYRHLVREQGYRAVIAFRRAFPHLRPVRYDPVRLDLDAALRGADLVLVHEWTPPELVARIGGHHRRRGDYLLLFHDTHHRSVTAPHEMAAYDLSEYDGVLAFGRVVRDIYLRRGWARRAWTWHEAADVRLFHPPRTPPEREGDLVWIGNWGDEERTRELEEYLFAPVEALGLRARVHGVRYPEEARRRLGRAGIAYAGWLPNYRVPEVLARYTLTVHIPRRPYATALPGVPTIRVFEALACGVPLVCSPWRDAEGLFSPGEDILIARDGDEMQEYLRLVAGDPALASELGRRGRATVLRGHTCAHRVDELMGICRELGLGRARMASEERAGMEVVAHG